jgi:hypothetical protein
MKLNIIDIPKTNATNRIMIFFLFYFLVASSWKQWERDLQSFAAELVVS